MKRRCRPKSFIQPTPGGRERAWEALRSLSGASAPFVPSTQSFVQLAPNLYLAVAGAPVLHGGPAEPMLPGSFVDAGASDMELPFWSPKYDASFDEIIDALKQDIDNDELGKISDIKANGISDSLIHRGHSEGIAMGGGRLITSVQEKRVASDEHYSGHVQIYFTPVDDDSTADIEFKTADHTPDDEKWSHAVIGQGVLGKDITDSQGNLIPDEIGMLCPLTHGLMGDVPASPHNGAPTDLIDGDGNRLSTHWHTEGLAHPGDSRPELQVPALIVFKGRLYLVALRHQFLYVYEIHWFGGANADGVAVWEKLVTLNTSNPNECITEKLSGTPVDLENYEAINLLLTDENDVFLLGSHERWLDTWHLGLLNPKGPLTDENKPRLTKVAIMDQNWASHPDKDDLFGQGCAIARMPGDERKTVGFWALPHDYRHSNCDNITGDPMCATVYTWERKFE